MIFATITGSVIRTEHELTDTGIKGFHIATADKDQRIVISLTKLRHRVAARNLELGDIVTVTGELILTGRIIKGGKPYVNHFVKPTKITTLGA